MKRLWSSRPVVYIRRSVLLYAKKNVARDAAGLAYFMLLAVFPLLVCLNALLGLLELELNSMMQHLEGILPQAGWELIQNYLAYVQGNESVAMLLAGLVLVFTSASAAFRIIMQSLSDIYEVPQVAGLRKILASLVFPLLLFVIIYLSVGVVVTGEWIMGWVEETFHWGVVVPLWRRLRFVLLFAVFFLFITLLTRLATPKHLRLTPLIVSSFLSSFALVAASMLFSRFISFSARYPLVYGSLMSMIVMILWLYLCGNILLAGNIISSVWYRAQSEKALATTTGGEAS